MIPPGFDIAGISAGKRMGRPGSELQRVVPFNFHTDVNI